MADLVTNIGKEYIFDETQNNDSITLLLYEDATDIITETNDVGAITTEPDTADSYARQSTNIETQTIGDGYGATSTNRIDFDVETNTETVDAAGLIANFESTVAGDTSANDHLIAAGFLSQSFNLNNRDAITVLEGNLDFVVQNI